MKTILLIIMLLLGIQSVQAQPEVLKENTWYLNKLIIDNEAVPIPVNDEITYLILSFRDDVLFTDVCKNGGGSFYGQELVYIGDHAFQVKYHNSLAMNCTKSENSAFAHLYLSIFIHGESFPYSPCTYLIKTLPDKSIELIITNLDNNQAIYNNQRLSSSQFEKAAFKIYPNPVSDVLYLEWDISEQISPSYIEIYDSLGKLCLKQQVATEKKSVELQHLTAGMYIVKLLNREGRIFTSEKLLVKP